MLSRFRIFFGPFLCAAGVILLAVTTHAQVYQPDLAGVPDTDPQEQIKTFVLDDGFEVNLWASDPMITKPIHMNFDPQGRLWVASSNLYPHIKPGEQANDQIVILEDTNKDGVADTSTVFADGLLIPTGVAPGDGGAYVANSTELLFLKDTDGNGRADQTRVVLSGFGTEDTHHILHGFRWGFDGLLYLMQSIYIHSHIETPHGLRKLLGSGIWRFRPSTMELEVFQRGLVNPWGHHFDRWGAGFATDGAGGEGINYIFPGATFVTAVGADKILTGLNPGSPKHCGLEVVSGRHLPDHFQGSLIACDFRARRVCRFVISEEGSGFVSREQPELMKSDFLSFRPVDVKMGPDGAIYIADFYNPIIQHGEVDFRDPRRDHQHGRIWRITAKDRPLVEPPRLVDASVEDLLGHLDSEEDWTRAQAKRVLAERGTSAVLPALDRFTDSIEGTDEHAEHLRLEAFWVYQGLDVLNEDLLRHLIGSSDHRARAAAVRALPDWKDEIAGPVELLAERVRDEHARVRLEAVRALAHFPTLESASLVITVLNRPMDRFLDHALYLTLKDLESVWGPALESGEPVFEGEIESVLYAAESINAPSLAKPLLTLLSNGRLDDTQESRVLSYAARFGGPDEMNVILDEVFANGVTEDEQIRLLAALIEGTRARSIQPSEGTDRIVDLMNSENESLRIEAIQAAGLWKVHTATGPLAKLIDPAAEWAPVRAAAVESLGLLGNPGSLALMAMAVGEDSPMAWRVPVAAALASAETASDVAMAVDVLEDITTETDASQLIGAFLARKDGIEVLAKALEGRTIAPDAAKVMMRTVSSSGQAAPELDRALKKAGGIGERAALSAEEIQQLIADVRDHGDARRGETLYRAANLQCLRCHAIGGAGGAIGPDLSTIGASAQIDYLIDSIFEPSKAIKEGFHTLIVTTTDEDVLSGIQVRETQEELLIRDQNGEEISIPFTEIADSTTGLSLMPTGLADFLTRDELVDLMRFLSELGKGDFAVGTKRMVRSWELLLDAPGVDPRAWNDDLTTALTGDHEMVWGALYSQVDGTLPFSEIPRVHLPGRFGRLGVVRFRVDVTTPGVIGLRFNSAQHVQLWAGEEIVALEGNEAEVDLPAGEHIFTIALNHDSRTEDVGIELFDVTDSPAQVNLIAGKI